MMIVLWKNIDYYYQSVVRAKLADLGLDSFVRGGAFWEGEHVRLVLIPNDSKWLTKELISQVSASLKEDWL